MRRLRAHHAKLITLLCHKQRIVAGSRPDQPLDFAFCRLHKDDIALNVLAGMKNLKQAVIPAPD